jgi:hypothetical protein
MAITDAAAKKIRILFCILGAILIAVRINKAVGSAGVASTHFYTHSLAEECRGRDSNPHGLLAQRILSPLCLPFHHPGFRI